MGHEVRLKRGRTAREENAVPDGSGDLKGQRYLPWFVGVIAFFIYMRTMTPGMQMGDGTELAAAAHVLGVPHPTGYPLYMLLAKLWLTLTMAGDVIMRTTLFNALLMATAVGMTARILHDILKTIWGSAPGKAGLFLAGAGALVAGFLRFHWSNAVVTEVYALQFLLMVGFTRALQVMHADGVRAQRAFLVMTACMALGFAHHRLSVTMIVPWFMVFVLMWRGRGDGGRPPVLAPLLIVLAGVSLYAYLPLRAMASPPINWGDPDAWSRFYNHVRGTEYLDRGLLKPALGQTFSAGTLAVFSRMQTLSLLSDFAGQFVRLPEQIDVVPGAQRIFIRGHGLAIFAAVVMVLASLWGYLKIGLAGSRWFALGTVLVAVQNIGVLYAYNIADIRDYFLYPFWAGWVGLFAAAAWGMKRLGESPRLAVSYAALALPVIVCMGNWARCDYSDELTAELLSETILPTSTDIMPPDSILITDDDPETFTTWYRQHVRGERLDVLNFGGNFVYMPWYLAFFTPEQQREYGITLADGVAHSAEEYTMQLRRAIIDGNVYSRPIFTSINDGAVLGVLAQTYDILPVDAVSVNNRGLIDEVTTTVLYRIQVKDQEQ